jgi:hypothetical protein
VRARIRLKLLGAWKTSACRVLRHNGELAKHWVSGAIPRLRSAATCGGMLKNNAPISAPFLGIGVISR